MLTDLSSRLVSHRLRGFSEHENSLSALAEAGRRGVRHVEIDTRISADGQILVFHDARLDPLTTATGRIADYRLDDGPRPRLRGRVQERLATLEEFLERFATGAADRELLIDVKDPGAERLHCELIERAGLTRRVRLLSWWPEVLLEAHAVTPDLRLVLSLVPLGHAPWWLRFVGLFGDGAPVRALGRLRGTSRQARFMQDTVFRREPLVAAAGTSRAVPGRYPVCFTQGLPEPKLTTVLSRSGGGIATWPRAIDGDLLDRAAAAGLEVIAFSLDDRNEIEALLQDGGAALAFTNDAGLWEGQLTGRRNRSRSRPWSRPGSGRRRGSPAGNASA